MGRAEAESYYFHLPISEIISNNNYTIDQEVNMRGTVGFITAIKGNQAQITYFPKAIITSIGEGGGSSDKLMWQVYKTVNGETSHSTATYPAGSVYGDYRRQLSSLRAQGWTTTDNNSGHGMP